MLILRLVGIVAFIAIAANILIWVYTRERRYLDWAWRIGKGSIFLTLAVLLLFAAERLLIAL